MLSNNPFLLLNVNGKEKFMRKLIKINRRRTEYEERKEKII